MKACIITAVFITLRLINVLMGQQLALKPLEKVMQK
jgi:hypothetical protein